MRYPSPKKPTTNASYKCEICGINTGSEEALLDHKATNHKIGKISMAPSPAPSPRERASKSPRDFGIYANGIGHAKADMYGSYDEEPTDLSMSNNSIDQLSPGRLSLSGQENELPVFSLKEQHAFQKCRVSDSMYIITKTLFTEKYICSHINILFIV